MVQGSTSGVVAMFCDNNMPNRRVASATQKSVRQIAMVGTYPPRRCGIATFASDVVEKMQEFHPEVRICVYAMVDETDEDPVAHHGDVIAGTIGEQRPDDYRRAARQINESGADAVWIQHEYGIFGGECGDAVLDLVDRVAAPVILTLHTVLAEPSERQSMILAHLLDRASRVMVMSRHGANLLKSLYGVGEDRVTIIEHGAPDRPFGRQSVFKEKLGLADRRVLTTFGLLGPGKGLEQAIRALPRIVSRHPDVIYRIVGATHPRLIARDGEGYRMSLEKLAQELGVADHLVWDNRFVDTDELLDQLEACDIYITPYPGMQQSTSGTLSYAVALGKAVVSTPYLHARELLADGVGVLIDPDNADAIATSVIDLLDSPQRLEAVQRRAYARGRQTIWPCFADAVATLIEGAVTNAPRMVQPLLATPGLAGFMAMCDDCGMYQHAVGTVPDRLRGYCLDDNARALMLVNVADAMSDAEAIQWAHRFAAFVQHAWDPQLARFRNFLGFDRQWCEAVGSDDSNGRALWVLGQTAAQARNGELVWWAKTLFDEAVPMIEELQSPRAVAFAMLGAVGRLEHESDNAPARALLERGGALLCRLLAAARRPDWAWFEAVLGYDNPRLSQALIEAGRICGNEEWLQAGLSSLRWINAQQVSAKGFFRPVGSDTHGRLHDFLPFDQQPLEAQATIEAAASAYLAEPDPFWFDHARMAYLWFFGQNDRGAVLADLTDGRCRDGITARGPNRNCGAESILAFQLSHYAIAGLARLQPGDKQPDRTQADRKRGDVLARHQKREVAAEDLR
ncbi:glycosyltransferase family 4 protein [Croceicoccus sp. F390]|uniref:Glycosyltransferase family 4 protein n=1 Tax=Croceicoccus esteveae TaxID=3075597 RepID=A0ABU2ZJL8_9SPHN|nr:glycosyltransferase family 4 protein [Croceicoccus sp. F390]MDT0576807.1 glycosyltransferase family 4 protein [Croceicoccus sp. F390]